MFARKKPLNPVNRQSICRPWCSSGIWGDLGVKSNPNEFFSYCCRENAALQWWVALHEDEEMGIWLWANPQWPLCPVWWAGLALRIGKVLWGFCPDVEKAECFKLLFILAEETISYEFNPESRALILTRSWDFPVVWIHSSILDWPWSSQHISGTAWGAWKIPLALS